MLNRLVPAVFGMMLTLSTASSVQAGLALMEEVAGSQILVDEAGGCSTESTPVVFSVRIPEQLDDHSLSDNLRQYMNLSSTYSGRFYCYVDDGDTVYFEGRVNGLPVLRGRLIAEYGSIANRVIEPLAASPQIEDNAFNDFLKWQLSADISDRAAFQSAVVARLQEIIDGDRDSHERALAAFELAWTQDGMAYDANQAGGDPAPFYAAWEEYMTQAAQLGHPAAMYELASRTGLVDQIYEATFAQGEGDSSKLVQLQPVLAEHGHYLFDSAALNYVAAISVFDRAEHFGVVLERGGEVALAALPTAVDVENALNGRLRASTRTSDALLSGVVGLPDNELLQCDMDWCVMGGYGYFRFSRPDRMECVETGTGGAACDVTFRYISRVDFGEPVGTSPLVDFANNAASALSRANAINAKITLSRSGGQWSLTGPIETY